MTPKSYFIYTFGCAMNEYDSERMAAALENLGMIQAAVPKEADFILLNTCSVREKPRTKISSYLGRVAIYKEKRPGVIAGVAGCVAQQDGEALLKRYKTLDFVMGTDAAARAEDIFKRAARGERFADTASAEEKFSIDPFSRKPGITACVTIMKGCENFCSYCVVPFVRGKELSRRTFEIIDEIKRLVDKGTREVCLLGQNVNSYGKGLGSGEDFSDLLKMVDKIPGIKRIRFVTSHPKDFSEKMIHTVAETEKACRYIHLPLQSGSDKLLEAMNRGYTYKEYMSKIEYARKIMPDVGFSSDFIVGFPGETEEDFKKTLKALKEARYEHVFAFGYSQRPMTAAEKLGDPIEGGIKSERLSRLFGLQDEIIDEGLPILKGSLAEVLVLGRKKDENNVFTGCNIMNRNVNFTSERDVQEGELVQVEIVEAKRRNLSGREVA